MFFFIVSGHGHWTLFPFLYLLVLFFLRYFSVAKDEGYCSVYAIAHVPPTISVQPSYKSLGLKSHDG